jgi:hypothetical protein
MRTEDEVKADIRKLYAEQSKIRKANLKVYVNKSYLINGYYHFVKGINDRDVSVIKVGENTITESDEQYDITLWDEYEIPHEEFIQALETRYNIIKNIIN